jgi:hypothetical protein
MAGQEHSGASTAHYLLRFHRLGSTDNGVYTPGEESPHSPCAIAHEGALGGVAPQLEVVGASRPHSHRTSGGDLAGETSAALWFGCFLLAVLRSQPDPVEHDPPRQLAQPRRFVKYVVLSQPQRDRQRTALRPDHEISHVSEIDAG